MVTTPSIGGISKSAVYEYKPEGTLKALLTAMTEYETAIMAKTEAFTAYKAAKETFKSSPTMENAHVLSQANRFWESKREVVQEAYRRMSAEEDNQPALELTWL